MSLQKYFEFGEVSSVKKVCVANYMSYVSKHD